MTVPPAVIDLYLDESGVTGKSLLDPAQPHFVLASSVIGDDDAREILKAAFPTFAGAELKFQNIWRREGWRGRLRPLLEALGPRLTDLYIWTIDKRFCVLTKLIDYLIEPGFRLRDYDFYADAFGYRYANHWHVGLLHGGSPELYDAVISARSPCSVRNSTEAELALLRFRLQLFKSSVPAELGIFFEQALESTARFHDLYDLDTFKGTFELQLTSMLNVVSHWTTTREGPFQVWHAESVGFLTQADLWSALTAPTVPEQWHPVANGPSIQFPLPIVATRAVDSRTSPAVQLCDLLAGMTARFLQPPADAAEHALRKILLGAGLDRIACNGVNPGDKGLKGPPQPLRGADAVDRMVAIFQHRRGG